MTSNIGMEDVRRLQGRMGFDKHTRGEMEAEVMNFTMNDAVRTTFKPEFINRIDEVIEFGSLSVDDCEAIAKLQLDEMAGYLERTGVRLRFTPALIRHIAKLGWSPEYGARELRRLIRDQVENPLTEHLINARFKRGDTISIGVRGNGKVTMSRARSRSRASSRLVRRDDGGGHKVVA